MAEDTLQKWALILGASSGFGAASSLALARHGFDIIGVHLDRRATAANAARIASEIQEMGRQTLFLNVNAADSKRRSEVIQSFKKISNSNPSNNGIHTTLHSLAFGTLKPFLADGAAKSIRPADMAMTLDVMAHSLVYWTQDLFYEGLRKNARPLFE